MKKLKVKKALATVLATATLVSALGVSAFADSNTTRSYSDDVYSNNAPSETTTDYLSALSGSTAAANTTVLEILGINVTSTDAAGVYNSAGTNGQSSPINLLIFGSQWNQAADPYLWNFYCNFNANPSSAGGDYSTTAYSGWTGYYTLIASGNKSGPSGQATSDTTITGMLGTKDCNPAFYYEPDVLFSGDTVSGTSYLVDITSSAYSVGWSSYSAGSDITSGYEPIVVGGWNTKQTCLNDSTSASTVAMAEGIVAMAAAIEAEYTDEDGDLTKTGRYGSVLDIAEQLYAYNVGVMEYAEDLGGYYCSGLTVNTDDDGNYTFTIGQSTSGRLVQYANGVATDLYTKTGAATLTEAQFLAYAANGLAVVGVSLDEDVQEWLESNGIGYVTSLPTTVYGTTMQSADNMLGTAYLFGVIYGEFTSADCDSDLPTELDMLAYWLVNFYHLDETYLLPAMQLMMDDNELNASDFHSDYTTLVESVMG
ncbi:MAG: hypothetical protein LUB63_01035 [Oscillospiraceae bacterium]|nr:hypothetical protein [Oscillospiraceae bacterium]